MSDELSIPDDFDSDVRLFPLPNVVFFPQVMLPLHIFEPRYREMTADALAGDHLVAMALLKPGWEPAYEGRPAIHPVACLGKIVADQRLEDGRYNILLRGLSRIRIVEEVASGTLYRNARVQLLKDTSAPAPKRAAELRQDLERVVTAWLASPGLAEDQIARLFENKLPLGALCDILSFALPLDVEFKQELLQELRIAHRVPRLLAHLEANPRPAEEGQGMPHRFPPAFSSN
jgi:uncharacterized protein